jgi:spermidine synthase
MSALFEELDYQPTPIGAISLRRRRDLTLGVDVYEIKLDDEFLMSSLFTAAEIALARLGLAELPGTDLDVAVGGLGLGHTAHAALEDRRVRSLVVVEALPAVIEWHQRKLLPLGAALTSDKRCRFAQGDFFAMVGPGAAGLDPEIPGRRFHAILLDIDHSPRNVLHASHATFYQPDGLSRLAERLHPGGVFALWSNDPPDEEFTSALSAVFENTDARVVTFPNHLQHRDATATIYLARKAA